MQQDFSFDDIQEALSGAAAQGSAAEAHGFLSGLLCLDSGTGREQWLHDYFGPELAGLAEDDRAPFHGLFEATRRQLTAFDFSFAPLLPDDEAALAERAQALGEWCHGFLQGLGYQGRDSAWPGACAEILRDFLEIVRLDADVAGEADEAAYAELTEYVRAGVQIIHGEFLSPTAPQPH